MSARRQASEATRLEARPQRASKAAGELSLYLERPFLTRPQVATLAGCHVSTVKRSPLKPIGVRGRRPVYRREDVLRWLAGELDAAPAPAATPSAVRTRSAPSNSTAEALARLRALRHGGAR